MIGRLTSFHMFYTRAPPYVFAKLVRGNKIADTLEFLAELWANLNRLEAAAEGDADLVRFLRDQYWTVTPWCREVLITLAECDFGAVPKSLRSDILSWMETMHSTLFNENVNRYMHQCERQGSRGNISASTLWHRFMTSPELEAFDRPSAPITGAARSAATKVRSFPGTMFHTRSATSPFTDAVSASLLDPSPEWPNLTPEGHRMLPLGLELLMDTKGSADILTKSYMNNLAVAGSVIRKGNGTPGLVVHSTPYGFLQVPTVGVSVQAPGGEKVFTVELKVTNAGLADAEYARVTPPLDDWHVFGVRAVTPDDPSLRKLERKCVRLMPVGRKLHIAHYAAGRGFPGLKVDDLKDLFSELEVGGRKPTVKKGLIKAIWRKFGPNVSDDAVQQAIDNGNELDVADATATTCTVDEIDAYNMWDENEDFVRVAAKLEAEKKQRRMQTNVAKKPHVVEAVVIDEEHFATGTPVVLPKKISQAWAKTLLPPVQAKVSLHKVGGFRWAVAAPTLLAAEKSKAFEHETVQESWHSLRHCLRIVWTLYCRRSRTACPWDFSVEPPASSAAASSS